MNRRSVFVKHRFNLFYCYLFLRHSHNGGNVIKVETAFQIGEVPIIIDINMSSLAQGDDMYGSLAGV